MKLENLNTEAQVFGDIQQNEVGIEAGNMNKIVMMLSSNLYSNPIESFIREITSNAWDSHIEAGNDEPVVITMDYDVVDTQNIYVSIRDFGTGLSPERFNKVFRYMGASTKTESNDYHGFFGLGKFSPLAVSDMVYVTSYYEGIKYDYLMYKNGLGINIDLIDESETDERNGVNVSVTVPSSKWYDINKAIHSQLMFFDNVYYINKVNEHNGQLFNENKIKHYETFSIAKNLSDTKILLGKVLYPFESYKLNGLTEDEKDLVDSFDGVDVALKFEIGDLDVNPARETLHYTDRTIKNIINKLKSIKEELHSFKLEELNGGTLTKKDLLELQDSDVVFLDKEIREAPYTIPTFEKQVEVEGRKISYALLTDYIYRILHSNTFWVEKLLFNERIHNQDKHPYSIKKILDGNLINYEPSNYKNIEKKYIRQNFNEVLLREDWVEFSSSRYFKMHIVRMYQGRTEHVKFLMKLIYSLLVDKMQKAEDFDLSGLDQAFIDGNKPQRRDTKEICYEKAHGYNSTTKYRATLDEMKDWTDEIIVLSYEESNRLPEGNYKVIKVARTNKDKILKEGIGKSFEEFIEENKAQIIQDYIARTRHSMFSWEDRRGLKQLAALVTLPKADEDYLKFDWEIKTPLSSLFYYTKEDEPVIDDTFYQRYKTILEIMGAYNLDTTKGEEFLMEKLRDYKYVVNGVLKI